MAKTPDRLDIDKEDKKFYDYLTQEIFSGRERKEQFLFAMAVGFQNGIRRQISSREGFIRTEYLNSEDITLLNSIAMYHFGSYEVLHNLEEVYKIAEEFAHAGIRIIYDEATSGQPGSIFKKYELLLKEAIDTINFD